MADTEERVAIITGGASGLGAASAVRLAELGMRIVLADLKGEEAANEALAACQAAGVDAIAVRADVSNDADCRAVAQAALDRFGRIDILVNSAGTTRYVAHDDMEGLSAEDFQAVYAVNLIGPFQMIRACLPALKAVGRASVVNVSSAAGILGNGSSIAYSASKGALLTMTKSLARALAPEVRVNAVAPGFMATNWLENVFGKDRMPDLIRNAADSSLLEEAGTADMVADAVVFFCTDGARYITGETLLSDGGMHLTVGGKKKQG